MKPIVLDIETSGINKTKCGIWQIGAYDLNTEEEFLQEARIDEEDEIINVKEKEPVLKIIGKTKKQLREPKKQSQRQLIINFFNWLKKRKFKNFLCQNPFFDVGFLDIKADKYNLEVPFPHRSFDLHSIAQIRYFDINGNFLAEKDKSEMGLTNILKFCGMKDERQAHNALEDCRLTSECFSRLVYGKNLFPEYSKFPVPDYLLKLNARKNKK